MYSFLSKFFLGALLIYGGASMYLYLSQDSLLFFPQKPDEELSAALDRSDGLRHLELTHENIKLDGWMQVDTEKPVFLLYFGGNAEDIASFIASTDYSGINVISLNYRGYGRSTGSPSEAALFRDAVFLYDYLRLQLGIPEEKIFVMGRSLGTGVATYLASVRSVKGVILITPYDSILSLAQSSYPLFPVSWILEHKFESSLYAQKKMSPLLSLAAGKDIIIPAIHTQKLLATWNGEKTSHTILSATHENIMGFSETKSQIEDFIIRLMKP